MTYWYFSYVVYGGDQPHWSRHYKWQAYVKGVDERVKPGDIVLLGNQGNGIYAWGSIQRIGEKTEAGENLVEIGRGNIGYPLIQADDIAKIGELSAIVNSPKHPFTFLTLQQARAAVSRMIDPKPPEPAGFSFILGSQVSVDESLEVEFKDVSATQVPKEVYEYALAYASGVGGHIYFGIKDDGTVSGLEIKFSHRNELRQRIEEKLFTIAPPLLAVEDYTISFENVIDEDGNLIPDTFVIDVEIKSTGEEHKTAGGKAFHKGYSGRRKI
jgi:hypothetical protein